MVENLANKTMLEVAPPAKRTSTESINNTVEKIAALANEHQVDYINIPEIIAENHEGTPLYKNMDPREFGCLLKSHTKAQIVVNKVVTHLPSAEFDTWLSNTVNQYNINNVVFVGGNSNSIKYHGINVIQANQKASNFNINIGNIAIPTRPNEVERLIAKTQSGCTFFTTQILFEADSMKNTLLQYANQCKKKNLTPATFFLCFAPLSDSLDIEYIKWLAAYLPKETEAKLEKNPKKASVELAVEILQDIRNFRETTNLSIPLSTCVEPISTRNLDLAKEMLNAIRKNNLTQIKIEEKLGKK
ncbi:MAG: mycobacterial-type methylenetetrahydrofolate reductase [Candidatus Micrarchaeota archaeon]|nr:mycobacterial-type methylenetetrahydrofolate reductase [Candidatus Micrarchaeota archaeon]